MKDTLLKKILKSKILTLEDEINIKHYCQKSGLNEKEIGIALNNSIRNNKNIENQYDMLKLLIEIEKKEKNKGENKDSSEIIKQQIKNFEIEKNKLLSK